MAFETITLNKESHIATLTLNRPDKRNAINSKMEDDLIAALDDISRDKEVRAMILTGAGKSFCSGGDIAGSDPGRMGTTVQEISRGLRRIYFGITLQLYNMEIPTIAMVNGVASGWGFDLVMACDIRLGSEHAKFSESFVNVGITPATGGMWLLPRIVGLSKASELIFTGDTVDASEAAKLGILNRVMPAGELESETRKLAARIARAAPLATRLAKLQIRQGLQTDLKSAFELAANCQGICITSEDCKEAMSAILEKREPVFKGK